MIEKGGRPIDPANACEGIRRKNTKVRGAG